MTYEQTHEWKEPATMTIAESKAWRPEIEGWALDILPFYDRLAKTCAHYSRIVELGTAHGRSAIFLASKLREQNKGGVELWAIDQWGGGWVECARSLFAHAKPAELDLIRFCRLASHEAVRLFDDAYLDVVFVDADHSFEAVKEDLRIWPPKLRPGGLICGHDYSGVDNPGVTKAVDEACERQGWTDFRVEVTVWSARTRIA